MQAVLIGLGMVADTHLAAIKDAEGVSLLGVMGRSLEKAQAFAQKASTLLGYQVRTFETATQIKGSKRVDFAIVATPPDARLDIVRALAAVRIPILMEKPLERNFAAAREIAEICQRAGKPCGVVFQNRTRKAVLALKKSIDKGLFGDVVMAEIKVPWWRDQGYYDEPGRGTYARDGGGVLINQAIHTLDLALWILGPWKNVQAQLHTTKLHQMEAEDWAGAVFQTQNGAMGTLVATTAFYPGASESIAIVGTEGSAHLEAGVLTIKMNDGRTEIVGAPSASGGGADPMAFTHAWHQNVIEDFCSSLAGGKDPLASVRSALAAHAVIDAMEKSHKTGQRVEVTQE